MNRKNFVLLVISWICFVSCVSRDVSFEERDLPTGDWNEIAADSDVAGEAYEFAVQALLDEGHELEEPTVHHVFSQVVAGMRIQFLLSAGPRNDRVKIRTILFRDLEGVYSIVEWEQISE